MYKVNNPGTSYFFLNLKNNVKFINLPFVRYHQCKSGQINDIGTV